MKFSRSDLMLYAGCIALGGGVGFVMSQILPFPSAIVATLVGAVLVGELWASLVKRFWRSA